MAEHGSIWVTFAVPEEARPLVRRWRGKAPPARVLLTGMGPVRARRSIEAAFADSVPERVLSSGFAGGLNPSLPRGCVLLEAPPDDHWGRRLLAAGAIAGKFVSVDRILVTPADKAVCHAQTGADAVDMESAAIRAACAARDIPCLTVRVISDAAAEPLPLDFNGLMDAEGRLRWRRLVGSLARRPQRALDLLRFHRQVRQAAERLAIVLDAALR